MSVTLWTEKYRPQDFEQYVWRDQNMRLKAEEWLKEGAMPNLVLSGRSGLGKTSFAKMMLKKMGVPAGDVLTINASHERKIDELEDRIMGFVQTYAMLDNPTGIKYVLLDEADSLTPLAQRFLRAEIETYAKTARFILTCNFKEKISAPILGRCQVFHFEALGQEEFVTRIVEILDGENVQWTIEVLEEYIEKGYPDLRKCINLVQQSTIGGVLKPFKADDSSGADYMIAAVDLFKAGRFTEARRLIVGQASIEEYPEIFKYLYTNLHFWGDSENLQDDALIIIRDGLYKHALCADGEINLSATIAELARLTRT